MGTGTLRQEEEGQKEEEEGRKKKGLREEGNPSPNTSIDMWMKAIDNLKADLELLMGKWSKDQGSSKSPETKPGKKPEKTPSKATFSDILKSIGMEDEEGDEEEEPEVEPDDEEPLPLKGPIAKTT